MGSGSKIIVSSILLLMLASGLESQTTNSGYISFGSGAGTGSGGPSVGSSVGGSGAGTGVGSSVGGSGAGNGSDGLSVGSSVGGSGAGTGSGGPSVGSSVGGSGIGTGVGSSVGGSSVGSSVGGSGGSTAVQTTTPAPGFIGKIRNVFLNIIDVPDDLLTRLIGSLKNGVGVIPKLFQRFIGFIGGVIRVPINVVEDLFFGIVVFFHRLLRRLYQDTGTAGSVFVGLEQKTLVCYALDTSSPIKALINGFVGCINKRVNAGVGDITKLLGSLRGMLRVTLKVIDKLKENNGIASIPGIFITAAVKEAKHGFHTVLAVTELAGFIPGLIPEVGACAVGVVVDEPVVLVKAIVSFLSCLGSDL